LSNRPRFTKPIGYGTGLTDAVTLILIGYWRSETHPEWPDPADLVDPQWDAQERHMVTMYLASGTIARTYMGFSPCRLCGRQNGSLEYTDGEFIWPEGLAHYLDGHAVRLPTALVSRVIEKLDQIERATTDGAWWKVLTQVEPA
jgi:hypothetical protein